MAPLMLRLGEEKARLEVRLLATGQHRSLLDQALADFGLKADGDLALMRPGQDLAGLTARAIDGLHAYLADSPPDLVLAQGDTTTVFATALASYYQRIPFGHVEAGLRTGKAFDPFPEEKNRVLASHLASLHFAPTPQARSNLLREGISEQAVHVTGNTVIDALKLIAKRELRLPPSVDLDRYILVTMHRRESFGAPLERVCDALRSLVDRNPAFGIVWPIHPNPNVRGAVERLLSDHQRMRLIEPLGYSDFVAVMKGSSLILTDSGGIQEEAPSLGKPVLVLRESTERPEAFDAGLLELVGTDPAAIVNRAEAFLNPGQAVEASTWVASNPYGDGWASERISRVILQHFGMDPGRKPEGFPAMWPTTAS